VKTKNLLLTLLILTSTFWPVASWAAPHERVLEVFHGSPSGLPSSALVADTAGNLYGTTEAHNGAVGGTVYQLSPVSGGGFTYHILHVLSRAEGAFPVRGRLLLDGAGNLYGVATRGGSQHCGTVFELTPGSGGKWAFKLLHDFKDDHKDGCISFTSLAMDAQRNLYGATVIGGAAGFGVVYQLTPGTSGHWTETVLYNFTATDSGGPMAGLVLDPTGNHLYGATNLGVFVLTRSGNGWTESNAYTFRGKDGSSPTGGLIFDAAGNLYGANQTGGNHGFGVVYQLTPQSGGGWLSTVLHSFPNSKTDGSYPNGDLALDGVGNVYGTANRGGGTAAVGRVFKLTDANNTWSETSLHNFTGGLDGGTPVAGVLLDQSGNLYGTTIQGGKQGWGVAFEIAP